jgi:hypothetical protein
MRRPTVQAELAELFAECMTELGRDHDPVAERGESFADDHLILIRAIGLGAIEEGDAALDGSADQFDRILRVGRWAIS